MTLEQLAEYSRPLQNQQAVERKRNLTKKMRQQLSCDIENSSGMPARYRAATLENPIAFKEIYFNGLLFAENFHKTLITPSENLNMILWGNVGSGKTNLACAIGNKIEQFGYTALYATVSEVLTTVIEAKSFSNTQSEKEILQRYLLPDLLILDEVGLKTLANFELAIISTVIDLRYRNLKPIIAITNLQPNYLKLNLGDMAYSRLRGNGQWFLEMNGVDLRNIQSKSTHDHSLELKQIDNVEPVINYPKKSFDLTITNKIKEISNAGKRNAISTDHASTHCVNQDNAPDLLNSTPINEKLENKGLFCMDEFISSESVTFFNQH